LLVALSCSSYRSTTARLIGDVRVSVLKMFHPPLTLLTPMQTSPYTARSRWQMTPTEFPLLHEIAVIAHWRNDMLVTTIFWQCMTGK
jgi:hypothetical protein